MLENISIVMLRVLAIFFLNTLANLLFMASGFFFSAAESQPELVLYGYLLIVQIVAFIALILGLWFGAPFLSKWVLRGTKKTQKKIEFSEELTAVVFMAVGFLILSSSFQPLSSAIYGYMQSNEFTSHRELQSTIQAVFIITLSLFLILTPKGLLGGIKICKESGKKLIKAAKQ